MDFAVPALQTVTAYLGTPRVCTLKLHFMVVINFNLYKTI
jgi:hypothetical protein